MEQQQRDGTRTRIERSDLDINQLVVEPSAPTHAFERADYLRAVFLGLDYPAGPHAAGATGRADESQWLEIAKILKRRGVTYTGICMLWRAGSFPRGGHAALSPFVIGGP